MESLKTRSRKRFTEEQKKFMEEHASVLPWPEVTRQLNEKFGTDFANNTIRCWMRRNGFKSINGDARFKKGHKSWQTGLKGEEFFSHFSEEGYKSFMKNVTRDRKYFAGDEVVFRGLPFIVTKDKCKGYVYHRLKKKNRYVWEQHYGPIKDNDMIYHLDGDVMNCNIDNLICIPMRYLAMFRHNDWLHSSPEIKKAALEYCNLHYKLKDVKSS